MSRVGKHEIKVPSSVQLKVYGHHLEFSAKGIVESYEVSDSLILERTDEGIKLTPLNDTQFARSIWGTTQRNLSNIVHGLTTGFSTSLDLVGVGYRASVNGNKLTMQLGFSHDVVFEIPQHITIKCEKPTNIVVSGHNKQQVNQICAHLRAHRPPEPYKGKGVIRSGEFVVRKEGKKK
jgi:large subunit ribosomal protein L6